MKYYNCGVLGHYKRYFPQFQAQCTYCIIVDRTVENCPQLIAKWQEGNVPQLQNQNHDKLHNQNENQNTNKNVNQLVNPPPKLNQGPTVAMISAEPRTQDVDVAVVTRGGATTREDILIPQVRLAGKKKVQFDVNVEKDTFFEAQDKMSRNFGKLHVYEMPTAFDSTLEAEPSRQHGTLQHFFESCLSLVRDPDALAKIENILHRPAKGRKNSAVNSLHKKKTGKEMHMNIQIGDYEVDSFILDLGSDVNIMTRHTWKSMGVTY